jgi:hypothetical protein
MSVQTLTPADAQPLFARLANLRRRLRGVALARGVGQFLAVALGGTALAGVLDWRLDLPPFVRAALLAGLLAAAGLLALTRLVRPLRQRSDNLALALRVEARHPRLNDALASTVQFLERPDESASPTLQAAAVRRAIWQSRSIDFHDAVDSRGLKRSLAAGLVAAVGAAVLAGAAPQPAATALARLADPFGVHPWPTRTRVVITSPDTLTLRARNDRPFHVQARIEGVVPEQAVLTVWPEDGEPADLAIPVVVAPDGAFGIAAADVAPADLAPRFRYRLRASDGDSGWRSAELVPPPELVPLDGRPSPQTHLRYPAYTGFAPRDLADGGRSVTAIAGTEVRLRAATDRPVARAALAYAERPQQPDPAAVAARLAALRPDALGAALGLPLAPALAAPVRITPAGDGRLLEVAFTPPFSGTYVLSFEDPTGIDNAVELDVRVRPDPAPTATLVRPDPERDNLSVLPGATVTVRAAADDPPDGTRPMAVRSLWLESRAARGGPAAGPEEPFHSRVLFDHDAVGRSAPALLAGLATPLHPSAGPLRVREPRVEVERRLPLDLFRHADGSPLRPGDRLALRAAADDFDDVSPGKPPGRSRLVELTVVTPAALEAQLQQQLAGVRDRLQTARGKQREASERAEAALRAPAGAEAARNLSDAEQRQREVREEVNGDRDGLRAQAGRLRQALRDNPLPRTGSLKHVEPVADELDRLGRDLAGQPDTPNGRPPEPIESLLAESQRDGPNALNNPKLTQARKRQRSAEKQMDRLLALLEPWSGAAQAQAEARALELDQQALRDQVGALDRELPLGRPFDRLPAEQQEALRRAAGRQEGIEQRLNDLLMKMERSARVKEKEAADRAKAADRLDAEAERDLAEADAKERAAGSDAARRQEAQAQRLRGLAQKSEAMRLRSTVPGLKEEGEALGHGLEAGRQAPAPLREAAQQLRRNEVGKAGASQDQGADALRRLADALQEGRAEPDVDQLMKRAKAAGERLEAVQKEEDLLQKRVELARQLQDPAARQAELEQAAGEQEALADRTRDLAEELTRLQSPAGEELHRAANNMKEAAELVRRGERGELNQDDALDRLDGARRELQGEREELQREKRTKVADRLKAVLERQDRFLAESARIHGALLKANTWSEALARSLSDLGENQEALRKELEGLTEERFKSLRVFERLLRQSADGMKEASDAIADRVKDRTAEGQALEPGDRDAEENAQRRTVAAQTLARRRLAQLVEALKDDPAQRRQAERPKDEGSKPGEKGRGGPGDDVPAQAQLKALRAVQAEINERTEAFAKAHPGRDQLDEPARAELRSLERLQADVAELLQEFAAPEGGKP